MAPAIVDADEVSPTNDDDEDDEEIDIEKTEMEKELFQVSDVSKR